MHGVVAQKDRSMNIRRPANFKLHIRLLYLRLVADKLAQAY